MDKETFIKMIDEYISESNIISKEWLEALIFCKKELTKSPVVADSMYINHPLCDACRDYGDILFRDCTKCEFGAVEIKCKKCIHRRVCKFNIETGVSNIVAKIIDDGCLEYVPINAVKNEKGGGEE